MLRRVQRARAHGRIFRVFVVTVVVLSGFGATAANAGPIGTADPGLSGTGIDTSGTRGLVTSVRTSNLRAAVPSGAPRILIVGTGVQRALFPDALQPVITASGIDATDPYGYGTVAASTILQLAPNAKITSIRVPAYDSNYYVMKMDKLADALEVAYQNRGAYDLVLLAYPQQAALDPVAHLIGTADYGRYGKGMNLLIEAMLSTRPSVDGTIAAIPADKGLRDRIFARANLRQRDAVERYARQTQQWNRVLDAIAKLDDAGVAIVAPSGDFTRHSGETVQAIQSQTVFGLAAHPDVITVGSSYADGATTRVSPTSGRGPTLGLDPKPDILAPADMMTMLPAGSVLPWADDSLRVPGQTLQWARTGVPPSTCPSVQNAYKCVLQGTSMVSASVVAANLASLVASGTPRAAGSRSAIDDEVLRGLAWARASASPAKAYGSSAAALPWEEGAGVLGGLAGIDPSKTVVPLGRADFGNVGWNEPASRSIDLWAAGAPATGSATIESFLGPDQSGAAITKAYNGTSRLTTGSNGAVVQLVAKAGRYQGGLYAGHLTLTAPGGAKTTIPLSLTQGLPLDFKVSYAYNGLQTGGIEGERVEDETMILFASLPTNVGLIGNAFKNIGGKAFKHVGGDPTNNYYFRYGTTKNSFDGSVPPSDHGRGTITNVPPGFYRMHLLSDHGVEALQDRGREESLGIRLGSFGPDAAYVPGSNVLVGSQPPCDDGGPATGPFSEGCTARAGRAMDPSTGFCTVGNSATQVAFNVYCGEIAYAVPSAVVSRAVHLIEHDATASKSEWKTCGVDIPLDGSSVDLGTLTVQASDCEGTTVPTSWSFPAKAPGCLADGERAAFPNGHPTDVTATYGGAAAAGLPGQNFPVAVMTYRFELPSPNTYTTAGLSLSYVAKNAIVGLRFQTGDDTLNDASNSLLVVDDPAVTVSPSLERGGTKGSAFNEWSVMSANATHGFLSVIIIPTAWARTDLDPNKPVASVQLCDVGLRVATFGKQSYGPSALEGGKPTQFFPVLDRGLTDQIDPSASRVRPRFASGAFGSAGVEHESLEMAVQIPKNTTTVGSAAHHVLSPVGGPAYFTAARRWDGARQESVLPAGYKTFDPRYGVQHMDCKEGVASGETDPDRIRNAATCQMYKTARANSQLLAELTPDVSLNGRFFGILSADYDALKRGAGDLAYEFADADDAGAFDAAGRWASAPKFRVSDFFDESTPFPLLPISGVISIARDSQNRPVLHVNTNEVGGLSHAISTVLH